MEKKNLFAEILTTVTKYLKILVVIVIVGIFLSGIRVVESGNVALILRFGKLVGDTPEEQVHEAGLLLAFPYIIDEVITVPTSAVMEQTVDTYYPGNDYASHGQYLITGDHNICTMSASLKYMVSDPVAYALNVQDIPGLINACVSNAMLTEAANYDVDDLLTTEKDAFIAAVRQRAAEKLDSAGVGVTITTLEMPRLTMPLEVREVYEQVNAATVQAATVLENANSFRNSLLPYTQSLVEQKITTAEQAYAEKTSQANLALAEFWGLLEEFQGNPDVVKTRVYNAKVTQMITAIGKIRVVQDEDTRIFLDP